MRVAQLYRNQVDHVLDTEHQRRLVAVDLAVVAAVEPDFDGYSYTVGLWIG